MHNGGGVGFELIVCNSDSTYNEEIFVIDYENLNNWFVTFEPNADSLTATSLHLIEDIVADG